MVRKIIFEDEIILWWERVAALPQGGAFEIAVNGNLHGKTTKTHYELKNLQPETEYDISVLLVDDESKVVSKVGAILAKTKKTKKRLDVTCKRYLFQTYRGVDAG